MRKFVSAVLIALCVFSVAASAMESDSLSDALNSEGALLLSEEERCCLANLINFGDDVFPNTSGKIAAFLAGNAFFEKSIAEQSLLLRSCLSMPSQKTALGNKITYEGEEYALRDFGLQRDFYVWQSIKADVNCYHASSLDHDFTVYTALGEESAKIIADAIKAVPKSLRKYIKTVIFFESDADCYNGGNKTVWIRKKTLPEKDDMASGFIHEIGHILDEEFCVDEEIWRDAQKNDIVSVSAYGNSSRGEDFAEFSRLYFSAGNLEAVERVYPHRTKALRAILYSADKETYKDFEPFAAEMSVFAPEVRECMLWWDESNVLTAEENTAATSKYRGKYKQIWQLCPLKKGGYVIVNKKTGLCISAVENALCFEVPTGRKNQVWNVEEKAFLRNSANKMYLIGDGLSDGKPQSGWTFKFRKQ